MIGESPVDLLRQAAEAAPRVLPGPLGEATAAWLTAEASCHENSREVAEATGQMMASIASDIVGEAVPVPELSVVVSTQNEAEAFAREVLGLAEQQQAGRDAAVRIACKEFQRLDVPLPMRPEELMARVVDALATAALLRTAPEPSDPARGDVYVHLTADELCDKTTLFGDRVNVDSDDDGPVGVEVLGAVKVTIDGRTVLPASKPTVTRTQVRAAAAALFEWNNELAGDPRFVLRHVTGGVDREPYGALVDEVLHHLGIHVRN